MTKPNAKGPPSRGRGWAQALEPFVVGRIRAVAVVASLALLGFGVQSYELQVTRSSGLRGRAQRQHHRRVELVAERGSVYDATGQELAVNAEVDSVVAAPNQVVDLASTAEALASVLHQDVRALERRLAQSKYFAWVERHVTPATAQAISALALPGIRLQRESRRFYPGGAQTGPLIGYVDIDGRGLDGIELVLDDLLVGKRIHRDAVRDATGQLMTPSLSLGPEPGASVTLTLHRTLQFAAHRALRDAVKEHEARAATAVIVEVGTGNVLAMANWPTFDGNLPRDKGGESARNRAVTDSYEIGSIMKLFTIAAALQEGVVTPETRFDLHGGRARIAGKLVEDTHPDDELNVAEILKRSSNVGAAKIAGRVGAVALHRALRRLGFGAATGIELPGEQTGILRSPRTWGHLGLATHGYGYGMSSTPVQVTAALAALGSDGVYHPPRIVADVKSDSGKIVYQRTATPRRVFSGQTARQVRSMMAGVFDRGALPGTAHELEVPGFDVGAKTGTAHKYDAEKGGYHDDRYLSSFAGLAPIDNPVIAVLVVIDEPQGKKYYGGQVAGPVWVQIVSDALSYLRVPMKRDFDPKLAPSAPVVAEDVPGTRLTPDYLVGAETSSGTVPNFLGLGISRALEIARDHQLELDVVGSGRAIEQTPPAGVAASQRQVRVVFERWRPKPVVSVPNEVAPPNRPDDE